MGIWGQSYFNFEGFPGINLECKIFFFWPASKKVFDVVLLCILRSSAQTPDGRRSRQLKREVDENIKFLTFLHSKRDTKYIQLDIFYSLSVIFEGKFCSVATVVARLIYKSKGCQPLKRVKYRIDVEDTKLVKL